MPLISNCGEYSTALVVERMRSFKSPGKMQSVIITFLKFRPRGVECPYKAGGSLASWLVV